MRAAFGLRLALFLLPLAAVGCGPTVDLSKALTVTDVETGWHDAGVIDGKNKIVPAIAFKLQNVSTESLTSLQINALFRRVNEADEWGSGFVRVTGSKGLEAGETTDVIRINSQLGYTGEEPRVDLLKNSQFVDAKVELFAKYASTQWTRIGEFPITRQLEAQ